MSFHSYQVLLHKKCFHALPLVNLRVVGCDRHVLVLVYFEELNVKECADLLGWSASRVKVRAHRARARLREILAPSFDEAPKKGART